jgi:hypothetical protein
MVAALPCHSISTDLQFVKMERGEMINFTGETNLFASNS